MTQDERLEYLIKYLLDERKSVEDIEVPKSREERRRLLRGLMNVRPPRPVSAGFLKIQDEYLREVTAEKGITDCAELAESAPGSRMALWRGDITTLKVDAIVNAANSALRGCFFPCHGCIDNAIHTYAGVQLRLECDRIMKKQGFEEPAGRAKITPAYNLPSDYVIHTVGPVVSGELTEEHCRLLAECYSSCLNLAAERGLKTIAFCCISTGEFRFPRERAAEIVVKTVKDYLNEDDRIEKVVFNVFKEEDYDIYRRLFG